jgi:hypothetical protein
MTGILEELAVCLVVSLGLRAISAVAQILSFRTRPACRGEDQLTLTALAAATACRRSRLIIRVPPKRPLLSNGRRSIWLSRSF